MEKDNVMTTIESKDMLIHKIADIEDVAFFKANKTIIDSKADSEILPLTDEQKSDIIESKKEIEKGLYINHDELDKEVMSWLNEK